MTRLKVKIYIISLVILAIIFYGCYIAYNYLYQPLNIPLILGRKEPYKIKPEKSDTSIENNIYQSLYQKNLNVNTKLLPDPEKPLKLSNDFGVDAIEEIILGAESESTQQQSPQLSNKLVIEADASAPQILKKNNKSSGLLLQLGAFVYENSAVLHWNKLQKEYPKILAGYNYKIDVAQEKSHAVYYLMLNGVKTPNEGYSVCKKLIQNKQNCIVLK